MCRQNCDRVAAKFVENEFEKADRLMELFFQYQQVFKNSLERIKERIDIEKEEIDAELRNAGQFVVQQVSLMRLCCPACL
jgi:beta-catenin-like protein 1